MRQNAGRLPRETLSRSGAALRGVVSVSVAAIGVRGAGVVTLRDPQAGLPAGVNCSGRMAHATGQSEVADSFG